MASKTPASHLCNRRL